MAFLLNDNYMNAMETLSHTSIVAGIIVFVDTLLKVSLVLINIYIMRACSVSIWLFCKMLVDYFYD
jgi:hypothetical protein